MKIGEIIKKLRRERDVTQEKLADHLGITYQAISKWETGTALPDITLIVPLANFFGVSADTLFSLGENENTAKIEEYQEKFNKLINVGDEKAAAELMRDALTEFPRNYRFMTQLAMVLGYGANKNMVEEIITLCERVLEDCTEDSLRHHAIQTLCLTYPKVGQKEKAAELASKMPVMCNSSGMLLAHIYEGEERIRQRQENLMEHIDWINHDMIAISNQKHLTTEERIFCIETANNLYKAVYYDGNYLFYHCRLSRNYHSLAEYYMKSDKAKAVECLLSAEYHAAACDDLAKSDETHCFTSIFTDKCHHIPTQTTKSWIGTEAGLWREQIGKSVFDSIREEADIVSLCKRLDEKQEHTAV